MRLLREASFSIEELVKRKPYLPDVEYQSQRAYILARNPGISILIRSHRQEFYLSIGKEGIENIGFSG